jgi:hypothetical protein
MDLLEEGMARTALLMAIAVVLVSTGSAWAQAPGGAYGGVTPEGGDPPSPKPPPPGMQYVTWPGFRVSEAGSEVFLQLTGPVNFKEKARGKRLDIILDQTEVHLKNSLRPVITRNFPGTPVSQFRLRRLKRNRLRLEITLSRRTGHTVTAKTLGQWQYLIVAFPPTR